MITVHCGIFFHIIFVHQGPEPMYEHHRTYSLVSHAKKGGKYIHCVQVLSLDKVCECPDPEDIDQNRSDVPCLH